MEDEPIIEIDPDSATAQYLQLAATLRAWIADGTIRVGGKLPSLADLEERSGLARNTVRKALDVLRAEGLLETSPGRGLYVREAVEPQE